MGMSNYDMLLRTVNEKLENDGATLVVEMLQDKTQAGDGAAATILAQFYDQGIGVFEDKERAIELYTYGLDSGVSEAAGLMGDMYRDGDGIEANDYLAFECYSRGAALGSIHCATQVAACYSEGKGTSKNNEAAIEWGTRAAKAGDASAAWIIADILYTEYGKCKEAASWYEIALNDFPNEMAIVVCLIECLADPTHQFTIAHDQTDYARAVELCNQYLGKDPTGHIHLYLGLLYVDGKGVPCDVSTGHDYVVTAANMGNEGAKTALQFFRKTIFGQYVFQW